jgi:hypothetical protein
VGAGCSVMIEGVRIWHMEESVCAKGGYCLCSTVEFFGQGIGRGAWDTVMERSTSQIMHVFVTHNPTDHVMRPPHRCCMGELGLVRLCCGFRGVGCQNASQVNTERGTEDKRAKKGVGESREVVEKQGRRKPAGGRGVVCRVVCLLPAYFFCLPRISKVLVKRTANAAMAM